MALGDPGTAPKVLLYPISYPQEAQFSSYTFTKTQSIRLTAEADMRTQLFSVKPDVKEIFRNVKQIPLFSLNFHFEKVAFH